LFTLEYTDGYYIAKDGEGVIDLAEPENRGFAEFVVNALNAAQHNVQATGVDAAHVCPIHPIVFDVDGCFMCNPRA